ncbi:hypothetical protein BH23BAC4_BH23BAC4_01690 [soil metagenome]
MKGVDTIARIRCEFFVPGKSIKEIVREQHVSRRAVVILASPNTLGHSPKVRLVVMTIDGAHRAG